MTAGLKYIGENLHVRLDCSGKFRAICKRLTCTSWNVKMRPKVEGWRLGATLLACLCWVQIETRFSGRQFSSAWLVIAELSVLRSCVQALFQTAGWEHFALCTRADLLQTFMSSSDRRWEPNTAMHVCLLKTQQNRQLQRSAVVANADVVAISWLLLQASWCRETRTDVSSELGGTESVQEESSIRFKEQFHWPLWLVFRHSRKFCLKNEKCCAFCPCVVAQRCSCAVAERNSTHVDRSCPQSPKPYSAIQPNGNQRCSRDVLLRHAKSSRRHLLDKNDIKNKFLSLMRVAGLKNSLLCTGWWCGM